MSLYIFCFIVVCLWKALIFLPSIVDGGIFFIRVVCLILQELFEDWAHIELQKIEKYLPVFLESEYGDPQNS